MKADTSCSSHLWVLMLSSKMVTAINTTLMDQAAFVDYSQSPSHLVKYSNMLSSPIPQTLAFFSSH